MAARDETSDPVTFRLNRVVAWLEGTARAAMRREAESAEFGGAAFDDFAENECAWRETANALDARKTKINPGWGRSDRGMQMGIGMKARSWNMKTVSMRREWKGETPKGMYSAAGTNAVGSTHQG